MSKPDAWMPLSIGAYRADTTHLARHEHGGYLLLLMAGWTRGGSLPDDDMKLARMALATAAEWRKLRPVLAPFFTIANGEWRQKRLDKEFAAASDRTAKAVVKAQLAAAARWEKDKHASSNASGNAPSKKTKCLEDTSRPRPLSLRSKTKAPALTRCPPDFQISDRVKTWAAEKGHTNLDVHLEHFMSYVKRKAPKYADWDEALMTCIRDNWAEVGQGKSGGPGWWTSEAATLAKGVELGMTPRPGEALHDFRGRINAKEGH